MAVLGKVYKKSAKQYTDNRQSLAQNLNWASEKDRPSETKYLFINFHQGICWPKEMMTSTCITIY